MLRYVLFSILNNVQIKLVYLFSLQLLSYRIGGDNASKN